MFIKTTADNISIHSERFPEGRCYRAGSVVETDERRARELIEDKHAVPADGPESEPPAPDEPRDRKAR